MKRSKKKSEKSVGGEIRKALISFTDALEKKAVFKKFRCQKFVRVGNTNTFVRLDVVEELC